ncbi:hemoglobin/transferrin/lactoferrin receptor protein [Pseudorhizobium tarimense]|uniref:Hemoglobin/transferrin/lactoferrin receptor protein n=2 Tax=Pseudorhizobium tarimense TaxID=1079109 RepID=A0ABV2H6S5_9HYPH|nr:TonB-dependent hemoglobin/transferrin/lactoferrin family receptor [Pseudorhizobium tarimense]MCJ8519406.1 TonB-dependent hemoglobin/transferrin/lactoferrin family receptor [Pseudorhizobium tarimense]
MISPASKLLLTCTAVLAISAPQSRAQEATAEATALETIVVKGKRVLVPAGDVADTPLASQTAAEEIRKSDIQDLQDLARTTEPGVEYVDTKPGRPGGLFIRGLAGPRVVTLVDGIPIPFFENFARQGQATTGLTDTSSAFDFQSLSTVDVVRGADSSRIGSGALAGALVLRTLEPDDLIADGRDRGGIAKTTYDSEDSSIGASVAFARRIENTSVLFQGSYTRGHERDNKGTEDVYGASRTEPNPLDSDKMNLLFKLRQDIEGGHRIGLTAERYYLGADTDLRTSQSGSASYPIGDFDGYENTERDRVSLDYQYEAPSIDAIIDRASASVYWQRLDKESGSGNSLTSGAAYQREDSMQNNTFGFIGALEGGFDAGDVSHTIRLGGSAAVLKFEEAFYARTGSSTASSQSDIPDVTGKSVGIYVEDEMAFGSSGFSLTPGIRFDAYDYDPDGSVSSNSGYDTFGLPEGSNGSRFSPKLLATYNLSPEVQLFAQWSMGYRAPTVNELYLNFSNVAFGYAVVGNSDLEPEISNGIELGATYDSSDLTGKVTLFHNRYKNFIEQQEEDTTLYPGFGGFGSGTLFIYRNIPNVRISGVEAKVRKDFANGLFAHASLAYAYGVDMDTDEFIRSVAPFKSIIGIGYAQENWGTELTGVFSAGMRDDDDASTFDAPGYGIANLTGWWEPSQVNGLRVQAGVYNIFDKKYWNAVGTRDVNPNAVSTTNQPVDFYSEPGRTLKVSLTQRF